MSTIAVIPYQTGELAKFLTRVTKKRSAYVLRQHRDLRIEAILEATLKRTQSEIERRRSLRKRKWSALKPEWLRQVQANLDNSVSGQQQQNPEWLLLNDGQWGLESPKRARVHHEDLFNMTDFFNEIDDVITA